MKKALIGIAAVFVLALASLAFAHGSGQDAIGTYYESMEEIIESGDYSDLEEFRETNSGFGGPRWVNSQEDFEEWKAIHEENEANGISGPRAGSGRGMGRGSGYGRTGGCPMRQ